MSMFKRPKFWEDKNLLSIFLYPLSLITLLLVKLKKLLIFEKVFKKKVICIGNIFVGGTGKTPASIFLYDFLTSKNFNPVIIKKYYKNNIDEINMIKGKSINLIAERSRLNALKSFSENNYDVCILDDGLQDYRFKKDIKIFCFDQNDFIGNGFLLPAGPLRETFDTIKDADFILIKGEKDSKLENQLIKYVNINKLYYVDYSPKNINDFKNKKILAFAGIGNPENFFSLLKKSNLQVLKTLSFPDHYNYKLTDLKKINFLAEKDGLKVLTTEKDYYRLKHFNLNNFDYLKIEYKIDNKKKFQDEILKIL